jgi:hypothetical protein
VSGEYQMMLKNVNWYGATSSGYRCVDCAVEVQGRIVGSAPGWLGIMFGITDGWGGYLFRINENRQYSLRVKLESEWGDYLVPWTSSPQINPLQNWNRLRVVRRGSSIELYINGQYLAAANHSRFVGSLRVGLTASSRDQVPVDVRFDNFAVYAAASGSQVTELAIGADTPYDNDAEPVWAP